jgi:hypothetical protein
VVCLDIAPGDATVHFGGSAVRRRVYSVSGDQGVLRVSDLDSGTCKEVAISVFPGGNDLGDPLESQGRLFAPNFTTGTVAVVDVAEAAWSRRPRPSPAATSSSSITTASSSTTIPTATRRA